MNALRSKRFTAANYVPLTAASAPAALGVVIDEKRREFFGTGASYVWLGGQAVAATILGIALLVRSLPPRVAGVAAVLLVAVGVGYLHATRGGWPALALYVAFGWVAVRRRSTSDATST